MKYLGKRITMMPALRLSFYMFMIFFVTSGLYGCNQAASKANQKKLAARAIDDTLIAQRNTESFTTNVLANDVPAKAGDILRVVEWSDGKKGKVNYKENGIFSYDPSSNMDSGPDSFTYIVDSGGRQATATVNVTIEPGWGKPELFSQEHGIVKSVQDAQGNITVVWTQLSDSSLQAQHYDAAARRWGEKQRIDKLSDRVDKIQLVVDQNGRVTAIWWRYDENTTTNIYANHMTIDGLWSTQVQLNADVGYIQDSQLVVNSLGEVTAIWHQSSNGITPGGIYAKRMTANGVWNNEITQLDTGLSVYRDSLLKKTFESVMDPGGQITVVWLRRKTTTGVEPYANHMTAMGVWGAKATPLGDGLGDAKNPHLAVDSRGQVTAVWFQNISGVMNLYANHMTDAGVWNAQATLLNNGAGTASSITNLVVDSSGKVMLLWQHYDNMGNYNLYVNQKIDTTWGMNLLDIVRGGLSTNPPVQVLLDEIGQVTVVWLQFDNSSTSSLYANRLEIMPDKTEKWSGAIELESGPGKVSDFRVILQPNNQVTVAWLQEDTNASSVIQSLYAIQWNQQNKVIKPSSAGWGDSILVENKITSVTKLNGLITHSQGLPVVLWTQVDEDGASYLWSKLLSNDASSPFRVNTDKNYTSHSLHGVAVNPQGVLQLITESQSDKSQALWFTDFR